MGDVNVSLNLEDHSEGTTYMSQDMIEFQDCINTIEVEDLCSSDFNTPRQKVYLILMPQF